MYEFARTPAKWEHSAASIPPSRLRLPTSLYTSEALLRCLFINFYVETYFLDSLRRHGSIRAAKFFEKGTSIYSAKKATATAPGPAWTPMTLPTMVVGSAWRWPSQRAALSTMYFCSRTSLRPV